MSARKVLRRGDVSGEFFVSSPLSQIPSLRQAKRQLDAAAAGKKQRVQHVRLRLIASKTHTHARTQTQKLPVSSQPLGVSVRRCTYFLLGGPPSKATLTHISFQKTFTWGLFCPRCQNHHICFSSDTIWGAIYGSNSQTCAIWTGRRASSPLPLLRRLSGRRSGADQAEALTTQPGCIHFSFTVCLPY